MQKQQFYRTAATVRFWAKVVKTEYCWIWQGAKGARGHGLFRINNADGSFGMIGSHRFSYQEIIGPIPYGLVLDHVVCGNPSCVNPSHLEPVTNSENTRRRHALTTHCKRGHEFTSDNTRYRLSSGVQSRICKTCSRQRDKKFRDKTRE